MEKKESSVLKRALEAEKMQEEWLQKARETKKKALRHKLERYRRDTGFAKDSRREKSDIHKAGKRHKSLCFGAK